MKVESAICQISDSFVNGTNDCEAYPKRWVAALVQMNCEKKVAAKLDKIGFANYVPVQQEEHQCSDRRKKIDRVVIPMVVFARFPQDDEDDFRRLSFILKFITYPGSKELTTPIPDEQIENLKVGDSVRLVRGPMKGLEGELSYIEENKPIVAIRIDGLEYACVSVE